MQDETEDKRRRFYCNRCSRETNQTLQWDYERRWYDDFFEADEVENNLLYLCAGCEAASLVVQVTHPLDSEGDYVEEIFPPGALPSLSLESPSESCRRSFRAHTLRHYAAITRGAFSSAQLVSGRCLRASAQIKERRALTFSRILSISDSFCRAGTSRITYTATDSAATMPLTSWRLCYRERLGLRLMSWRTYSTFSMSWTTRLHE